MAMNNTSRKISHIKHNILLLQTICLLLVCGMDAAAAQTKFPVMRILPKDEAHQDQSLMEERQKLLSAIEKENEKYLWDHLDSDIRIAVDEPCCGIDEFEKRWKSGKSRKELWSTLRGVLSMGGAFREKNKFCAPYVFTEWPEAATTAENAVLVGSKVNIREKPAKDSITIAVLSYEILKVPYGNYFDNWVGVITPQGKSGYVYGKYLRNPLDFHLCLQKNKNKWLIMEFMSGR